MSYSVYSTRGFILGSAPSGEASKTYTIYTEDFGLVRARAQSVRSLSSKLRYNLDDYAFGTFSLVRGREFWRLTGALRDELDRAAAPIRARVLSLVKRLVQGEEKNPALFEALMLLTKSDISETGALADILGALGYIDPVLIKAASERDRVTLINKALHETQL